MGTALGVANILFVFIPPVGVIAYLLFLRPRLAFRMVCGTVAYLLFHLLLRQALFSPLLFAESWYVVLQRSDPAAETLLLGLISALAEECGRWLSLYGIHRMTRRNLPLLFESAAFGAGYGGLGAILAGVDVLVSLFLMGADADLTSVLFSGIRSTAFFLIQIALSVMTADSILRRRPWYFFITLLLHALFSAADSLLETGRFPEGAVCGALTATAAAAVIWSAGIYRRGAGEAEAAPPEDDIREEEK